MVKGILTSADPADTLHCINSKGICLYDIEWPDELTVTFRCVLADKKMISHICQSKGNSICFHSETGWRKFPSRVFRHPILLFSLFVLYLLTLYLPGRVLFVRVEGNQRIPDMQILEAAEHAGIRFGALRKEVRSEKMKNALLEALPELKWTCINTSGCTAVISVRERTADVPEKAPGITAIAAVRDGYVTSCTVTKGSAVCAPGDTVCKGQILISGYDDCGFCIRVTDAEGEVFADTSHSLQAVFPLNRRSRHISETPARRYSIILGKKRINLWKGSGISPVTCDRMYKEYYMTLPGGFQLPLRLCIETVTPWQTVQNQSPASQHEAQLLAFGREQILSRMIAGNILQEESLVREEEGMLILDGNYRCSEMIGRVISEEIGDRNGKNS